MEPILSNSKSSPCAGPINGSNCIPYNGDAIPCINQCAGDTVSDILDKLGRQECYTQSLLDLTGLDLSCCYTPCPDCPSQPTKIVDVLQIMMGCICAQGKRITTLEDQMSKLNAGR